jgi:uncharacterized membrane protein YgdD (TMEM256/DUF423 family)
MIGAEILTTIAQLSVAVTGLSGIAIAFNRQPGRLSDFEAFRVLILFANSLAAMFLSLIPFAFYYMNWSDVAIWRTGSILMLVFEVAFLAVLSWSTPKFVRQHRELFNIGLLCFFGALHVLNTLLQLVSALGCNRGRGLSIFLFGLLWLLFHSVFSSAESFLSNRSAAVRCHTTFASNARMRAALVKTWFFG